MSNYWIYLKSYFSFFSMGKISYLKSSQYCDNIEDLKKLQRQETFCLKLNVDNRYLFFDRIYSINIVGFIILFIIRFITN